MVSEIVWALRMGWDGKEGVKTREWMERAHQGVMITGSRVVAVRARRRRSAWCGRGAWRRRWRGDAIRWEMSQCREATMRDGTTGYGNLELRRSQIPSFFTVLYCISAARAGKRYDNMM